MVTAVPEADAIRRRSKIAEPLKLFFIISAGWTENKNSFHNKQLHATELSSGYVVPFPEVDNITKVAGHIKNNWELSSYGSRSILGGNECRVSCNGPLTDRPAIAR